MNNKEDLIQYIQQTLNSDKQLLEAELDEVLEDWDRVNYLIDRIAIGEEILNDLLTE
jgi:AAA+ ATPase superfamily predicted ATPase